MQRGRHGLVAEVKREETGEEAALPQCLKRRQSLSPPAGKPIHKGSKGTIQA